MNRFLEYIAVHPYLVEVDRVETAWLLLLRLDGSHLTTFLMRASPKEKSGWLLRLRTDFHRQPSHLTPLQMRVHPKEKLFFFLLVEFL